MNIYTTQSNVNYQFLAFQTGLLQKLLVVLPKEKDIPKKIDDYSSSD